MMFGQVSWRYLQRCLECRNVFQFESHGCGHIEIWQESCDVANDTVSALENAKIQMVNTDEGGNFKRDHAPPDKQDRLTSVIP